MAYPITEWTTGVSPVVDLAAHKDRHDPEDGADPLDTAVPSALLEVQAQATGTSHSLARADHDHAIVHDITDNSLVTVDGTTNTPVNGDYTKWTAYGLEGVDISQMRSALGIDDNEILAYLGL